MSAYDHNSTPQQLMEQHLLTRLAEADDLTWDTSPTLPPRADPDAVDTSNRVLVEALARIGPANSGQKRKITGDMLKLLFLEDQLGGKWRKVLLFSSQATANAVLGDGWAAQAAKHFGVEVRVIEPDDYHRQLVLDAQERHGRRFRKEASVA